ncbi:MAG TPA: NADH-ubiquinone oxidoreductase-F iron-sulfur binding region domain-containing protein, partial [Ilumatobacteraceae bacterium]
MDSISRVLPAEPYTSLAEYVAAGGGVGLPAAQAVEASVILDELEASGLRGRGGAGFPTATKWRTVLSFASDVLSTDVVVNAAEGEPGKYKDRTILLANPYAVLEGALIAAQVVSARTVTIATKARFADQIARLRSAIDEIVAAGWAPDVEIVIAEGPPEYLFGEETALLEVLDGRPPFPRLAPPWRRGVVEIVRSDSDVTSGSGLSADVHLADTDGEGGAPPVLVNNVETMANIAAIIGQGAAWFRTLGTDKSPGTILCTVTGAVQRPAVIEVAMGTPLSEVIAAAGGLFPERSLLAVLNGVSNPIILPADIDTEVSYEAMAAIGSGLGSGSFIVVDDSSDPVALAAGVSRFLGIESCGQCTPCKQDGLEIHALLTNIAHDDGGEPALVKIGRRLDTITVGARCNIATQHSIVVGSIVSAFEARFEAHLHHSVEPIEPMLIAELQRLDNG